MSRTTTLPDSVDDLTALVIEQQNKLDHQSLFIEQLLEQIRLAQHNRFGVKSESILPDQLRLWLDEYGPNEPEAEDAQDDEVKPARPKTKRGRRRLPTHLPRIEINHTLDDEACQCEHCNERMVPLSEKVTEQLDIVPAKVRVLRHHRTTYHCPECKDALKTAPLPPQPIPKSNASPGLLAWLIIAKYLDGMPLYRLERKLKRYGMSLTRSTQASWMIQCGQLIQPMINLMRDRLLGYDIIAMDESRYQVLNEAGKSPQSQSYIWVQRGGPPESPVILYDYDPSRSQDVPLRLLDGFQGYLQTDAYEGYGAVCRQNKLISVGCLAHARRKFDEALKAQKSVDPDKRKSTLAAEVLKQIQALYRIEREIKHLSVEEKHAVRQERAVPLLKALRQWLDKHIIVVPPKSTLGRLCSIYTSSGIS